MRIIKSIVFVFIVIVGLSACAKTEKIKIQPSTKEVDSSTVNTKENYSMNREIVIISKINKEYIIVENTQKEKYKIQNNSKNYKEGDYLMIHFKDDQKKKDATQETDYIVNPSLIEETSIDVQKSY